MATRNTETPEDPRAPFFVPPPPRRRGGSGGKGAASRSAPATETTPKTGRKTGTKPGKKSPKKPTGTKGTGGAKGAGGAKRTTGSTPKAPKARAAPKGEAPRQKPAQSSGIRLTGRGGVLVIMAASLSAALTAEATGWAFLNGASFVVACIVAALLVRPTDLLGLTVSPPLAYFTAAVAAESVLTLGSTGFVRGLALGLGTRLADIAPWLFLGTALVLIIAVFRGLPSNVRDFSDELNGRRPRA